MIGLNLILMSAVLLVENGGLTPPPCLYTRTGAARILIDKYLVLKTADRTQIIVIGSGSQMTVTCLGWNSCLSQIDCSQDRFNLQI